MASNSSSQFFKQELALPGLQLNVTSQPWSLGKDESRMILGRDVIHPGRIAPDGGRKPVGCSIPSGDQPLTSVIECEFIGRVVARFQDNTDALANPNYFMNTGLYINVISGPMRISGWPEDMVGGYIGCAPVLAVGVDQGRYLWEHRQITSIDGEKLYFSPAFSFTWAYNTKFWITYQLTVDRNGILVSNGRKFWLLQNGTYHQYMDLGSDDYLGERWRGSMIASDRMILTSENYPPRLYRFAWSENTDAADETSYAGLTTPVKPPSIEPEFMESPIGGNNPSFPMAVLTGEGSLSAGKYRVKVRAINLDDGVESRLVPAFNYSDFKYDYVTASAGDAITCFTHLSNDAVIAPPYGPKWTHLEIWRTEANGAEYFLEGRIPVIGFRNEMQTIATDASAATYPNVLLAYSSSPYDHLPTCSISDTDLNRHEQLTVGDVISGYRPPVCKEAVSLQGVTICAGRAAEDADAMLTQYSYGYILQAAAKASYDPATRYLVSYDLGGALSPGMFANLSVIDDGTYFVIQSGTYAGTYKIFSRIDANTITLYPGPEPPATIYSLTGYVRRAFSVASEKILLDEDVFYSRTDKYSPESFPLRTMTVSRTGDKFMGLRVVGKYAAMVMADGVHLLYLTTDVVGDVVLEKHTVATAGAGTPWPDSIVAWDRQLVWATSRGPVVMQTSDDPDTSGFRGKMAPLDQGGSMRSWFEEAYREGYSIDAGVDTHNGCVRFRRKVDSNTYEVLQFCYVTGLWTLIDDDSGFLYVRSKYAGTTEVVDPLLYSINTDGSAFEVNHYGFTHPYDTKTVQAVTSAAGGYTIAATSITNSSAIFSADMLGDTIRFRSSTAAVDGAVRVITAASTTVLEFDAVTGLADGDEFIVGATRFRLRSMPISGRDPYGHKVLRGVSVKARPGPRVVDGTWSVPSGTPLSLRTYRDHYAGEVVDEQLKEMAVFEESDVTKLSQDRVSAVAGSGTSMEIELECIESRTDFVVESLMADVREEYHALSDASETE